MQTTLDRTKGDERAIRLIEAYRERGERRAMERLLSLHGRLLNKVVSRYAASSGEPREDLLQIGYVGLVKAVKDYDTSSPARFSSYAYAKLEGELQHHLRDSALVKRPRWAKSFYSKMSAATTRLTAELGRPPLVEEIAREVNVAPEGVMEVMKLFADTDCRSLDAERGGEESPDLSAIKSLQYETFSLPIEDRILLEESLKALTELQRKAVYLFFYRDLTQTEVGKELGVTQRKVSDIIASATRTMRKVMG
jgi:RNA polymerase sigma-B factor